MSAKMLEPVLHSYCSNVVKYIDCVTVAEEIGSGEMKKRMLLVRIEISSLLLFFVNFRSLDAFTKLGAGELGSNWVSCSCILAVMPP